MTPVAPPLEVPMPLAMEYAVPPLVDVSTVPDVTVQFTVIGAANPATEHRHTNPPYMKNLRIDLVSSKKLGEQLGSPGAEATIGRLPKRP